MATDGEDEEQEDETRRYMAPPRDGEPTLLSLPDEILVRIARMVGTRRERPERRKASARANTESVISLVSLCSTCRRIRALTWPSSSRCETGTLLWREAATSAYGMELCMDARSDCWHLLSFISSRLVDRTEDARRCHHRFARACGDGDSAPPPPTALGVLADGRVAGAVGLRADGSLSLRRILSLRAGTERLAVELLESFAGSGSKAEASLLRGRFEGLLLNSVESREAAELDLPARSLIDKVRERAAELSRRRGGGGECVYWRGLEFLPTSPPVRGGATRLCWGMQLICGAIALADELEAICKQGEALRGPAGGELEYAAARLGSEISHHKNISEHVPQLGGSADRASARCFALFMHLERAGRELRRRIAAFAASKGRRPGLVQKIALLNKLFFLAPGGVDALEDDAHLEEGEYGAAAADADEEEPAREAGPPDDQAIFDGCRLLDFRYDGSTCLNFEGNADEYVREGAWPPVSFVACS